jgi:hypothetical protein
VAPPAATAAVALSGGGGDVISRRMFLPVAIGVTNAGGCVEDTD